jgi:hypothetical protein
MRWCSVVVLALGLNSALQRGFEAVGTLRRLVAVNARIYLWGTVDVGAVDARIEALACQYSSVQ